MINTTGSTKRSWTDYITFLDSTDQQLVAVMCQQKAKYQERAGGGRLPFNKHVNTLPELDLAIGVVTFGFDSRTLFKEPCKRW